jgi:hypothetical protein
MSLPFLYKALLIFTLVLSICVPVLAQQTEPPLSNQEFVRLLNQLPKDPGMKDELIELVRRRGIGFTLTDGLRSLIATKSKSDVVLRRTVEEADRRRTTPEAHALPSAAESEMVLKQCKEATLAAADAMPDFMVKQLITRSYSASGVSNWQPYDHVTAAVGYRVKGGETYRVLNVNGVPQVDTSPDGSAFQKLGGSTSTGEFVTVLVDIFKDESHTSFNVVDTDTLRERKTIVYEYEVQQKNSEQRISVSGAIQNSVITGYRGRIWIDRDNYRVLRLESAATEIPSDFPIKEAGRKIDYDWVLIGTDKFLLPSFADVMLADRTSGPASRTRNEIKFRGYQKFGTDVTIIEDGDEVGGDPGKQPNPVQPDSKPVPPAPAKQP